MKWQTLALSCVVVASLGACGKTGSKGETGAVPGTPTDSTSMSTPAPAANDTAAMPSTPADTGSMKSSDTSKTK